MGARPAGIALGCKPQSLNIIYHQALPETRLASGGVDKSIRIWDLLTGTCLVTLSGHMSKSPVPCDHMSVLIPFRYDKIATIHSRNGRASSPLN